MSLNNTPLGERVHIGIFGKRNAGKSSLINALTNQNLAIVSEQKGTTTDPVFKAMELLPLGPVVLIDTPGLDDEGALGSLRVEKAKQVLHKTDLALLIVDVQCGLTAYDEEIIAQFVQRNLPYLIVFNKADSVENASVPEKYKKKSILVSSLTGANINLLREQMAHLIPSKDLTLRLIGDLLKPLDLVILVVPIDSAAPKGRLILPQQQVIRDILEAKSTALVVQTSELAATLARFQEHVKMVVTDSQAFGEVAKITPPDILLTSFSILFARYKGDLKTVVEGAQALSTLQTGDKVLIGEGCTHHRQCDDIGTVKLPHWIRNFTKQAPDFTFSSGTGYPDDLSSYKMIVHCGACMLNEQEVKHRMALAKEAHVPFTNYGIAIAHMHGILKRTLEPFPEIYNIIK